MILITLYTSPFLVKNDSPLMYFHPSYITCDILPCNHGDGIIPFISHPLLLKRSSNFHIIFENAHHKQNVYIDMIDMH
jgi:hypothetical protein